MSETRILVVDDEVMVRDAVRITLAHFGYAVDTASNAAEALDKLQCANFALVITDLKMPEMSGDRLAAEIKLRHPLMPVILLTGFPPQDRPKAVDAVLLKPFSTMDLRSKVIELTKS